MARMTLTASNGETVEVWDIAAGMETGFGRVVHGWAEGLEDWKIKDGYTVVAAAPFSPGAIPIADAYQRLHEIWNQDTLEIASYELEMIKSGESEDIWGSEDDWAERYEARIVARARKEFWGATADAKPLTYNPFAALAA